MSIEDQNERKRCRELASGDAIDRALASRARELTRVNGGVQGNDGERLQ
jgi:hypothetical protein